MKFAQLDSEERKVLNDLCDYLTARTDNETSVLYNSHTILRAALDRESAERNAAVPQAHSEGRWTRVERRHGRSEGGE